jgi:Flp pilus assembly protein CpaB
LEFLLKRANKLMLLFGVILAAASFVVVLAFGSLGQQQPPPVEPDVSVVVAATNVNLGATVTAEMLTTVNRRPAEAVGTFQHPEELVGNVARRAITQGAALVEDDFESSVNVPELVRSLQPGLRAMAVPLSKVDSVGMLLQAGDYVDVILSMADTDALNPVVIQNPSGIGSPTAEEPNAPYIGLDEFMNNTSVKVIVQNVQVLAALPKQESAPTNVIGAVPVLEPDVVVILAVQPQQVEAIRFAQLDGRVSMVLRSPADIGAGTVGTTGITLKELVDRWGVLPPLPVTP